ncbi:hypothetical protein JDV02_002526 [Purpureocillium takamizusanense]|uniref:Oxidase ustYa n=1 Tax=Purpureocillium takamizusanense TaxID=2060973 RepID=A0A9Q8QAG6_9HYPO|nr:uncharacterized protein JDV02_002526 [Purpureocillium takamizusanense]UNI16050.1 hypothetical protein JDV02_002526 [Purpureocillium takamizusanense]
MFQQATKLEAEYKPLAEGDGDSDTIDECQPQRHTTRQHAGGRSSRLFHIGVICLELVLCVLLTAGFIVLDQSRRSLGSRVSLDGLSDLGSYNTTMRFENNSHLLADTHHADRYWSDLLESAGVVSLNTEWARHQGLRPSAQSPTDASQSIYQVDVFHALHCLNSIRQNLMSKTPPAWDEKHVLHCLDYVRHQLLCHPDLTLVSTNDLDEFVLDETHTCRDYGAMLEWIHRHRWIEFPEWLQAKGHKETHDH